MTLGSTEQTAIIRTERGLAIAGTRISIYDVMDHLAAGRSPELETQFLSQRSPNFDAYDSFLHQNVSGLAKLIPCHVLKLQHNF